MVATAHPEKVISRCSVFTGLCWGFDESDENRLGCVLYVVLVDVVCMVAMIPVAMGVSHPCVC